MSSLSLNIEVLSDDHLIDALLLMQKVFFEEQQIPVDYLPVKIFPQISWGIFNGDSLIGLSIAWKEEDLWHWGRYAVHPQWRGKGLGRKLAQVCLSDLFQQGAQEVHIDARNVTLKLLLQFGAKVVGDTFDFYGPVTPMRLKAVDFFENMRLNKFRR
ncbi:MAG: GNAT family N-acetyltransferase [Cyclobacteriaceae bacterium]|nr:GNAT family N-acetyltransferase [Cyclobacteriaceae bacterium]